MSLGTVAIVGTPNVGKSTILIVLPAKENPLLMINLV